MTIKKKLHRHGRIARLWVARLAWIHVQVVRVRVAVTVRACHMSHIYLVNATMLAPLPHTQPMFCHPTRSLMSAMQRSIPTDYVPCPCGG